MRQLRAAARDTLIGLASRAPILAGAGGLPEHWPWQAAFQKLFTAVRTTPD